MIDVLLSGVAMVLAYFTFIRYKYCELVMKDYLFFKAIFNENGTIR